MPAPTSLPLCRNCKYFLDNQYYSRTMYPKSCTAPAPWNDDYLAGYKGIPTTVAREKGNCGPNGTWFEARDHAAEVPIAKTRRRWFEWSDPEGLARDGEEAGAK
jgi:hypothetical protein